MRVELVRALLAAGEIAVCAGEEEFIDSDGVESFWNTERDRIGKVLQEMVREAEDMGLYDIEPLPFRR